MNSATKHTGGQLQGGLDRCECNILVVNVIERVCSALALVEPTVFIWCDRIEGVNVLLSSVSSHTHTTPGFLVEHANARSLAPCVYNLLLTFT